MKGKKGSRHGREREIFPASLSSKKDLIFGGGGRGEGNERVLRPVYLQKKIPKIRQM